MPAPRARWSLRPRHSGPGGHVFPGSTVAAGSGAARPLRTAVRRWEETDVLSVRPEPPAVLGGGGENGGFVANTECCRLGRAGDGLCASPESLSPTAPSGPRPQPPSAGRTELGEGGCAAGPVRGGHAQALPAEHLLPGRVAGCAAVGRSPSPRVCLPLPGWLTVRQRSQLRKVRKAGPLR